MSDSSHQQGAPHLSSPPGPDSPPPGALNPYQSPEAAIAPDKPLIAQGVLTQTMLDDLKRASPWIKFVAVLGFVASGLTALSGVFIFAWIPFAGMSWRQLQMFGFESLGLVGAGFSVTMTVLFIGAALLIFYPSLFMYRFGEKIRSYLRTGSEQELELAFKNNRFLWKFFGIVCIIYIAFLPGLIIVSTIVGVVAAFS